MTREDILLTDALYQQKNDFKMKRHMIVFYTLSNLLGRMEGFCKTDQDIIAASAILENVGEKEGDSSGRRGLLEDMLVKAGYPISYFDEILSHVFNDEGRECDPKKKVLDESLRITGCLESENPRQEAMRVMNAFSSSNGLKLLMNLCLQPGL